MKKNKVIMKKIKRTVSVGICVSLMTLGLVKNVKGTAMFYAISETQEMTRWCWVASARGVARGETTVTATQADGVRKVKGSVVDAGGTVAEALEAAQFYSPSSDFIALERPLTYSQMKACLDNGHLVLTCYFPTAYSTAICGHAMFVIGYDDTVAHDPQIRYCDPSGGITKWYSYEVFGTMVNDGGGMYEYTKSIFCRLK